MTAHAKVISLLERTDLDFRKIVFQLAKTHPKAVCAAADAVSDASGWKKAARELLNEGRKIDAIRVCREYTGWSLHDSKAAVESLL